MKNFHLPLSEALDGELRGYARDVGKPATLVAREALVEYLKEKRREHVRDAVEDWARSHAGGPCDLDEALAEAGAEALEDEA